MLSESINIGYLKELKKEYESQDNRCTAYPIYVSVQELVRIGVIADGYFPNCPYGDAELYEEYRHKENCEQLFYSYDELMKWIRSEDNEENLEQDEFEKLNVGYIWHPVEFFLTIKGAEEYIAANQHNHGKLRTYVHHFERRNYEMRALLEAINLKVRD